MGNLKNAAYATVSRVGILYIKDSDVGSMAYTYSWIDRRNNSSKKSQLRVLFNNNLPRTFAMMNDNIKHVVPIRDIAIVKMTYRLLEGLLTEQNIPAKAEPYIYEPFFVFAGRL